MKLLTQNSDLKRGGIWGWTLPAHWTTLPSGQKFNTCPSAGICAGFCYAKSGTYNFRDVKASHIEKLRLVLEYPDAWREGMISELAKDKYQFIRIHDAGDFFSREYAQAWIEIASRYPSKLFYAYTKEVSLMKSLELPDNFILIYSYGGREDHLIDPQKDRHSDVFPSLGVLLDAGYFPIGDDDKQAALSANHRIGLISNNIPHLRRKQGERSFRQWTKTSTL